MQPYTTTAYTYASPAMHEVQQLAIAHNLGTLQYSYTRVTDNNKLFISAVFWILTGLIGIASLVTLTYILYLNEWNLNIWEVDEDVIIGLYVALLIWSILAFGFIRTGFSKLREIKNGPREQGHIFTNGVVYFEGKTEKYAIRWHEMVSAQFATQSIVNNQVTGTGYMYIETEDTFVAMHADLQNYQDFAERIQRGYVDYHLPKLLDQYEAGEKVEIDDIVISKDQGIGKYDSNQADDDSDSLLELDNDEIPENFLTWLPWNRVSSIEFNDDYVHIHSKDEYGWKTNSEEQEAWYTWDTEDCDNLCLLKPFVERIGY